MTIPIPSEWQCMITIEGDTVFKRGNQVVIDHFDLVELLDENITFNEIVKYYEEFEKIEHRQPILDEFPF